ncbi:MAG: GTPase ObgE, partial [Chloroflexota bacterium]|nr:GTPase ObgE [Chloroflexota bacterium]
MFLDQVTITVHAGDGGDGAATFRREAHVPRGGPDGGDGGRGGSVYLRIDAGETMLRDYRFRHHFRAGSGGRGQGSRRHGKAGADLELAVPPGTVVTDLATGDLIADLVAPGQRVLVARGGRGGLGNVHFATATHRTPRHAQKGEPGEERRLRLELRLIADVGLVGLPNAGKSTLLAALTAATPQIAPYPFTTLEPNLGVLDLSVHDPADERRVTIADMPGLIEGASGGAGLGLAFLRHVARTRLLVHVVDLAAADPWRDYQTIREELEAHDPRLVEKVTLIVANKLDLAEARPNIEPFRRKARSEAREVTAVSAREGEGIDALLGSLARLLPDAETLAQPGEPAGVVVHRLRSAGDAFSVVREDAAYRVSGRRIERLAAQTDFDNEESA